MQDILDSQGKTVHYSGEWEAASFTNGTYNPGKSFRLYCENAVELKIKGNRMSRKDAFIIGLTEGYHNFVCDQIIEDPSANDLSGVIALF